MNNQLPTIKTHSAGLFDTVYTKKDLQLFYKEIDQLVDSMFKGQEELEEKMDKILSVDKKKNLFEYLKTSGVKPSSIISVKQELQKIKKMGDALPVVNLVLAVEPTYGIIKNISLWFTKRFGHKVIIDLSLERKLLGGAFISFNGLYKDYTLRTRVDKYFNRQRVA